MPIIRTNVKTFHCIDDVACDDVLSELYLNKLKGNAEALATTGHSMFNGGGAVVGGEYQPLNGWTNGKNYNDLDYWTYHEIETTALYNRMVLQAEVMLGAYSGRNMQWINFWLYETGTTNGHRIHEVRLSSYGSGTGITPLNGNTKLRIRIDQEIPSWLRPAATNGAALDFRTHLTSYGTSGQFTINSHWYWAGILNAKLKFYRTCE